MNIAHDFESKMNWLGTITPRIGWNLGQWMPYIKGGYAVAELRTSTFFSPNGAIQTSSKDYVHGWTIGGGLEWKIRSNVTLGIEYDYVRLNGDGRLLVDTFNGTVPSNHFIGDIELHQVMVRLNVLIPHGRLEEALK